MSNNCPSTITPIFNGDNFKHYIAISDTTDGIRTIIQLTNVDITVTYTTPSSSKSYIATKVGTVYTNCSLDIVTNQLKVIFESYDLDNGGLNCKVEIKIPDTDYPDGYATYTRFVNVGIELVNSSYFLNG